MSDSAEQKPEADLAMQPPLPRHNERVRRLDTLLQEEKKALAARGITVEWLRRAEEEIQQLLERKATQGHLYNTQLREQAAARLGRDVSTIHRMMERYAKEPGIDALLPKKRGAPRGQRLTDIQQWVICCLYLKPIPVKVADTTILPGRSTVSYIHQVLTAYYPPAVSDDTVRRFIDGIHRDHSLIADMARRGE